MPRHIHADLMLQYAQDAQESEKPWENWEARVHGTHWAPVWETLTGNPIWHDVYEYRRKPRTIVINGFTVNAPIDKETETYFNYYYPSITSRDFFDETLYLGEWDGNNFQRGLCFTNKEDAIAMAKAMLRIDLSK